MMERVFRSHAWAVPIIGLALGIGLSLFVGSAMRGNSNPIPVCGTWGVASPPRGMAATPQEALLTFSADAAETALNSVGTELDRWNTHASSAGLAVVDTTSEGSTSFILQDAGGAIIARYTAVQIDGVWGIEEFWHTMPDAFCMAE